MPEAPELEVVKGFLTDRAVGASVESARVLKPSVLRSIAGVSRTISRDAPSGKCGERGSF